MNIDHKKEEAKQEIMKKFIDSFYVYKISQIVKDSLDKIKEEKNEITENDRRRAVEIFTTLMKARGIEADIDWILTYK